MDDSERILNIMKRYSDKLITIGELQGWFSTLPLGVYFTDEQVNELEYQLEYIQFCVSTEKQYDAVMSYLTPMMKLLKK